MKIKKLTPLWLSLSVAVPLAAILLVSSSVSVTASEPAPPIVAEEHFVEVPQSLRDCSGIYIRNLSTGQVVVSNRARDRFIPASVTKAVTSAAVLSLIDSVARFDTEIVTRGKVSGSVLNGDVVVRCSGDPTIGSSHLGDAGALPDSIAAALSRLGIRRITGTVIIDESRFDASEGVPGGWLDEDLIYPYGAELFGANYRDNAVSLSLPSGRTSPSTPDLRVTEVQGKAGLTRDRSERQVRLSGKGPRSQKIANPVPYSTMKADIIRRLDRDSIAVGEGRAGGSGPERRLCVYHSPRYVDILRSLMVRSDNLMAEGMLRSLAPGESRKEALAEERESWADLDIDATGVVVEDGSGLSRTNRLTPVFLADVLTAMADSRVARSYIRLFPRVGREGTVRNFMKGAEIDGTIVLKTGSMRGVQSYAGYRVGPDGYPTHVIVFMANGFKGSRDALKTSFASLLKTVFSKQNVTDPAE